MVIHNAPHPFAGQLVRVKTSQPLHGEKESDVSVPFRVEDWWDRLGVGSWKVAAHNTACLLYAARSGFTGLPFDDEVVYGHTTNGMGHLVHDTEILGAA